jgi:hypothetical protein
VSVVEVLGVVDERVTPAGGHAGANVRALGEPAPRRAGRGRPRRRRRARRASGRASDRGRRTLARARRARRRRAGSRPSGRTRSP